MLHKLFQDFSTLFVVVNPIGAVPLFIAVVGHESRAQQRVIATQGVLIAFGILLAFIVAGQPLLWALGIGLTAFQVAGGLVLLIIALRMVFEEVRTGPIAPVAAGHSAAVFPVAMPFLAGPATIMAVVLLTDDEVYTVWEQVETAAVLIAVLVITYACLIGAELVQRVLGTTGTNVVSRVMGLLLAALAMQSLIGALARVKFG